MGKKSDNSSQNNSNSSEKTRSTKLETQNSCDKKNSEISCEKNRHILKYKKGHNKNNNKINNYSKKIFSSINYIFCILGIICAWGAIDSLVDVISGKQVYISLICYSVVLLVAFVFLTLYICFIDRNYKPHELF
ncbi:conserved Plasmodium protein, unknown function [Plasmodium gallinaceum]|uniref:Uncharacterized protein n=1 Tax=Plasmodium gallinaceum TaxID=5849 RepID=A0A1J1GXF8_PLAGA|nr:conserved Plasmodium protein, unknown function [Plasmodium gallinaceum]CRG97140.1 conserved Plasmodium protein, unknown function [Plasmodium gallinaceum]